MDFVFEICFTKTSLLPHTWLTRVILCGLMVTTLIFVISLTAFSDLVVHVNKVDNIDWDIDEGSFEGGADKREVRMDGSLPGGNAESGGGKVEPAPEPTTSGECRGVLSRSFGDNESKLCLLYTSPSPRDRQKSRMPSSA